MILADAVLTTAGVESAFSLVDYYPVFLFLGVVTAFALGTLVTSQCVHWLGLKPFKKTPVKEMAYESGMDPIADAVPQRWFTSGFIGRAPETVEGIVAMVRATQPRGYAEACGAIRDMDQREAISAIMAPTLVIAGAHDPATPIEHAEELIARIPGADLVVLDASHVANVEQPEDFNAAVVDFLRD